MESKKINQLATELAPDLSDLTIIGDPTTGISKKITLSQMASLFTGTVEEYATLAAFPLVGVADTIYIALDTNILYRWNTGTSAYVELSPNIVSSLVFNDANGFDGTIALVGSVATLTITTALTTGSVGFIGASGALLQDNANFFWDDTNNRLGLGTNAPTTALDVFGSGIIGRINGTSTNNAYLGFASNGTNKWSAGNVQSDHRFRIFSEANSAELITILQTGEFGIGIANPLTKLHIDGGATALIANLDANVSVAKSVSFRSDNSSRINLEVSGTESGSDAGADLFIRRYSDAGSLLDTPLFIKRSTGFIGINTTTAGSPLTIRGASNTNMISLGVSGTQSVSDAMGITFTSPTYEKARIVAYNENTGNAAGYLTFWTGGSPLTTDITERMRITSSGNVGIGTNSPADLLEVKGGFIRLSGTTGNGPQFNLYSNGQTSNHVTLAQGFALATDNIGYLINRANADFVFGANNSEKMRVTSAGNLLIGCTTSDSYGGYAVMQLGGNVSGLFQTFDGTVKTAVVSNGTSNGLIGTRTNHNLQIITNDTIKMTITPSGNIGAPSGTNIYNASDKRLKQNIVIIENALEAVLKLNPVKFNWLDGFEESENGKDMLGFIAQEVQSIIPEAVENFGNSSVTIGEIVVDNPLRVNEKFIIPYLAKAIQELNAEIEELKAKLI